ncbi:hypothetical protein THASP1DRAFT_27579 [Thamnocephalis sphaerospora]|uniref:FAS1 domain-containing protein n=1 Tax=Thamnocephalis sphaerospora TaxID=78915 RepID=A0A4P9XY42_9FUNG|nr:hypothetical protein THASP1DRAFT_27579 [Thamnocephalis sphaerospora]|eukprot:RKP10611.1 hypothetical protein THASP1DRAFT_27579 [Thamnocephalis sphaerospora]
MLFKAITLAALAITAVSATPVKSKTENYIMYTLPPYMSKAQLTPVPNGVSMVFRPSRTLKDVSTSHIYNALSMFENFTQFYDIVVRTGGLEHILQQDHLRNYTIFAPVNNPNRSWSQFNFTKDAVAYHMLGNAYDLSSAMPDRVYRLPHNSPTTHVLQKGKYLQVNCALIVGKPIKASNGIIYPINFPLDPEKDYPVVTSAAIDEGADCKARYEAAFAN